MLTKYKMALKELAIRFAVWFVSTIVVVAIVKGFSFGAAILPVVDLISAVVLIAFVIIPTVRNVTSGEYEDDFSSSLQSSMNDESKRNKVYSATPSITEEIDVIRHLRTSDIQACLADSGFFWDWQGFSIKSLVLYESLTEGQTYEAAIHMDPVNQRVDYIDAVIGNKPVRYLNVPYVEAMGMKAEVYSAPVIAFLAKTIPDAQWEWIDGCIGKKISLSSASMNISDSVAELTYSADKLTEMTVSCEDGATHHFYAGFAAPVSSSASAHPETSTVVNAETSKKPVASPTAETQPERTQVGGSAVRTSPTSSVVVKEVTEPSAPVEVQTIDDTSSYLLEPTDVPNIDDAVLKQNASLVVDYMFQELCEAAMETEANGENFFTKPWPEGLQTMKEVEFFVSLLVEKSSFIKGEVDAEKQTYTLYLENNNMYNA